MERRTTEREYLGDYHLKQLLGEGLLGSTYLAEHRLSKKNFVLKLIAEEWVQQSGFIPKLEKHLSHLLEIRHPRIGRYDNLTAVGKSYFIVTEPIFNDFGECENLFHHLQTKKLKNEDIVKILYQTAECLDALHAVEIPSFRKGHSIRAFHRALKFSNILMGKGGKPILVDVGIASLLGEEALLKRGAKVQPSSAQDAFLLWSNYAFLAPEQKWKEEINYKSDQYAFGVLAYYLVMKRFPEGLFPLPQLLNRLLTAVLQQDPKERPEYLTPLFDEDLELSETVLDQGISSLDGFSSIVHPSKTTLDSSLQPKLGVSIIERPSFDPDPMAKFRTESHVALFRPEVKQIEKIEPLLTEMKVIAEGDYFRGSSIGARDERPLHQVHLSSFAIDVHPVTNEQFVRFLETMGGEKDGNNNDMIYLKESKIRKTFGRYQVEPGFGKHPVVGVTWYGAFAYSQWVGKRLPTEAEWEISAKAGEKERLYPSGESVEKGEANFFSSETTAVMSYAPNPYGLYDMAGNVYEWCSDWYEYNYYDQSQQESDNPKGPQQGVYRVLRGGCWKSLKEDLRCSHRHRNSPSIANRTYGFRCAADVKN